MEIILTNSASNELYEISYLFSDLETKLTPRQKLKIIEQLPTHVHATDYVDWDFNHRFIQESIPRLKQVGFKFFDFTISFYLIGYIQEKDEYQQIVFNQRITSEQDELEPDSITDLILNNDRELHGNIMTFKEWVNKSRFVQNQFRLVVEITPMLDLAQGLSDVQLESGEQNLCTIL